MYYPDFIILIKNIVEKNSFQVEIYTKTNFDLSVYAKIENEITCLIRFGKNYDLDSKGFTKKQLESMFMNLREVFNNLAKKRRNIGEIRNILKEIQNWINENK